MKSDEIADLKAEIEELKQQVELLTAQLRLARRRAFGASSEKTPPEQLSLFNEAETESDPAASEPELPPKKPRPKKPKGKREADLSGLPTEQVVHELPEDERVCPCCGGAMHACGHEVYRHELTVVPAQFKVTEHVQTLYSCRNCEQNETSTPMKKSQIPAPVVKNSGVCSPSLLAHIAQQKYALALPLYRQEQDFKRNGVNISRQNMANWIIFAAVHWLFPFYERLKISLLQREVLHADETRVQVLKEPKPKKANQMWVYRTSGDTDRAVVLYEYQANRLAEHAVAFLTGFSGFLHTDGYAGYAKAENVTIVGCWAHMRRYFFDALGGLSDYNQADSVAGRGMRFCNRLFELEREYAQLKLSHAERFDARIRKSKPIVDAFCVWAKGLVCLLPQSPLGKAVTYAQNQQQNLSRFLLDGRLEISNNRAERAVRPFTIGRKNWLFCNVPAGARASAAFYSIVETAKENRLIPFEYLAFLLRTIPNLDFETQPELLDALLPWNAPPECRCKTAPIAKEILPWDET